MFPSFLAKTLVEPAMIDAISPNGIRFPQTISEPVFPHIQWKRSDTV
jgi:hypothetical protein